MIGGVGPLKRKFCIEYTSIPLLGATAVLSRIVTNALFASQL